MHREALNLNEYPRRAHFEYFSSMANPYVGLTQQTDVTKLRQHVKERGLPMFLSTLFAVTQAANTVEPFRQRIVDGGIVQYEWCRPSYTVALENDTYCYCSVGTRTDSLDEFVAEGKREQDLAVKAQSVADGEDDGDLLFISCLPWMRYSAITQPTPTPADSNPRITWGEMYEENGRVLMPLTVLCNHALVDGLHIARFYEALGDVIRRRF